MSRLIYEGDLNKNFGEYYPTPYIDKVEVRRWTSDHGRPGYQFDVEVSFLFTVPEYDPAIPTRDIDFIKEILDRVNVNLMFTKSKPGYYDQIKTFAEYSDPSRLVKTNARLAEYQDLTGIDYSKAEDPMDELSLLLYDPSILPIFIKSEAPYFGEGTSDDESLDSTEYSAGLGYDLIPVSTEDFIRAVDTGQVVAMYDKTGRKILKIKVAVSHNLLVAVKDVTSWYVEVPNPNINLLAFSSMLTKEEILSSGLRTNSAMKLMFGDVAYEKILEAGSIASQLEESFFDDNEEVYIDIPLQALNNSYHKADTTTHQDIYDKFTELIQRYISIIPGTPEDAESNDPELIGSIDVIQYNLQTYKDKVDLLKQINNARKMIINRSSGTRTGALFKDMAIMLGRANDVVMRGTPLTKKLTVNAKVIDMRASLLGSVELPTPTPTPDDELFQFQYGRTIVWSNETSARFKISDYIDRTSFGGMDIGSRLLDATNWYADAHSDWATDRGDGRMEAALASGLGEVEIRYTADGYVEIHYTDPVTGDDAIIKVPAYQGAFDEIYGAREEYNVTFGYTIFDWQTALINNSTLANLVNVQRFIDHFGMELVQRYFIPAKYEIVKYKPMPIIEGTDSAPPAPVLFEGPETALTFSKQLATTSFTTVPIYSPEVESTGEITRSSTLSLLSNPESFEIPSGAQIKNYSTERNVSLLPQMPTGATATTSATGIMPNPMAAEAYAQTALDHKLFYIEFQNIDQMATLMDYTAATVDYYKAKFEIWDYTKSALVDLIKHYYYLHLGLKHYLEDASLACSYNNVDGVFNDFFAESMQREFITNPAGAPWIFCAATYIKHVDFLTNKYNNDEAQMLLAAREIIQRISPQTGTLDQLKAFYQNFIDLYVSYYSPSSTIGRALSLLGPHDDSEDDYAFHHGVHRTYTSDIRTEINFSNQDESGRDTFLNAITTARQQYENASSAYASAIDTIVGVSKADMRRKFDARIDALERKIKYEIDLMAHGGGSEYGLPAGFGCKYAWWWDGWKDKVPFGDFTRPPAGTDPYGSDAGTNEFGKIDATSYGGTYGYVIVDPYNVDEVVDVYDVRTHGEPTVFMNFRKDEEHALGPPRCRYVKRAYRARAGDFRFDDEHRMEWYGMSSYAAIGTAEGWEFNKFGGYHGTAEKPQVYHEYSYTNREDADIAELRTLILKQYEGEGDGDGSAYYHYLRRMPGHELLFNYDTYEQWLAASEAGTARLGYDYENPYEDLGSDQFTVWGSEDRG